MELFAELHRTCSIRETLFLHQVKNIMLQNKFIIKSFFSQFVSRWYSTNPAVWWVPRVGSILPIQPTHSRSGSFCNYLLGYRKKMKMLFTSQGRSTLGKTVPSILCAALSLWPRVVSKTSGTVFPNTDLPSGE